MAGLSKIREGGKYGKVGNWVGFKVRISNNLTLTLILTLTLTLTVTLIPVLTLLDKRNSKNTVKGKSSQ